MRNRAAEITLGDPLQHLRGFCDLSVAEVIPEPKGARAVLSQAGHDGTPMNTLTDLAILTITPFVLGTLVGYGARALVSQRRRERTRKLRS